MKYAFITLFSVPLGLLLQIDPDVNTTTSWGIISILAGVVSALAIYHSKRQKDWEKKFEQLTADHKKDIMDLSQKMTDAYVHNTATVENNKISIEANTKTVEEQTRLLREMRDKILKMVK